MVGKTGKKAFLRRTLSRVVRKMVLGCFPSKRQEYSKLFGSLKRTKQLWVLLEACHLPNFHAKIDSTSTKYIGHNFTKVTTFIT